MIETIKPYLTKQDIKRIFGIGYLNASKIFELANEIDEKELGKYRIFKTKIRITSLCKVMGLNLNVLQKTKMYAQTGNQKRTFPTID